MAEGTFRAAFYFRLTVIMIALPPLRQRGGDVLQLAERFPQRFAQCYQRPIPHLTAKAQAALRRYPWPGNVRELAHVIERVVFLERTEVVRESALALTMAGTKEPFLSARNPGDGRLDLEWACDSLMLERAEKTLIKKALTCT